jgi:nitroreductase
MASPIIDFMLSRSSAPIQDLKAPGPSDDEIALMLKVATRVPDHGRLAPWRFILYRGKAREEIGEGLAALAEKLEGPLPQGRKQKERERFSRAPLVIGVISSPKANPKIPEWEMRLSGAAVAMNLLHAAGGLGYGANWITNWYSDVEEGRSLMGLAPHERVIGFVHIGTYDGQPMDRPRPDVSTLVSEYSGPWTSRSSS